MMDSLLQRLSNGRSSPLELYNSSNGSVPITPATDEFASTPTSSMGNSAMMVDATDYQKLKRELQEARHEITRMNQEMHSHQVARATMDHITQPPETDYSYTGDVTEQTLAQLQSKFNASTRLTNEWESDPIQPPYSTSNSLGSYHAPARPPLPQTGYRRNGFLNEPTHFPLDQSFRNNGVPGGLGSGLSNSFSGVNHAISNPPSRPGSAFDPLYNHYTAPHMYGSSHVPPVGTIGSRLSPDASEFSTGAGLGPSPWNSQVHYMFSDLNPGFI